MTERNYNGKVSRVRRNRRRRAARAWRDFDTGWYGVPVVTPALVEVRARERRGDVERVAALIGRPVDDLFRSA